MIQKKNKNKKNKISKTRKQEHKNTRNKQNIGLKAYTKESRILEGEFFYTREVGGKVNANSSKHQPANFNKEL